MFPSFVFLQAWLSKNSVKWDQIPIKANQTVLAKAYAKGAAKERVQRRGKKRQRGEGARPSSAFSTGRQQAKRFKKESKGRT